MFKVDLGNISFLNNLINSDSENKPTENKNLKELSLEKIQTSRLSKLLESQPMLAYVILQRLGWKIDQAARSQIYQTVKDMSGSIPSVHNSMQNMEMVINNNGAIIAQTHEKFKISFIEDPQINTLYPFSKKRNVEILAYSIDQYCDLSSYEDYELGFSLITSVAWSDYRMRNQRDMLISEGYDVDIASIAIEDTDTKVQYYHTWLYNNYKNGRVIIKKFDISDLIKTKSKQEIF